MQTRRGGDRHGATRPSRQLIHKTVLYSLLVEHSVRGTYLHNIGTFVPTLLAMRETLQYVLCRYSLGNQLTEIWKLAQEAFEIGHVLISVTYTSTSTTYRRRNLVDGIRLYLARHAVCVGSSPKRTDLFYRTIRWNDDDGKYASRNIPPCRVVSCVWAARARVGELVLTVRFTTRAEAFLIEITLKYLYCFSLSLATEQCTLEVCAGAGAGCREPGASFAIARSFFSFDLSSTGIFGRTSEYNRKYSSGDNLPNQQVLDNIVFYFGAAVIKQQNNCGFVFVTKINVLQTEVA